jgi:hypothetical protein
LYEPLESQAIGAKPPKIKSFVVNITVTVADSLSHFEWTFELRKPSRLHDTAISIDESKIDSVEEELLKELLIRTLMLSIPLFCKIHANEMFHHKYQAIDQ